MTLTSLLKNKDLKNYFFLFLANFGVLPIALVSNILLARYLGPHDFGSYMYLIALITLFTTIFTFGFFQAGGRAIVLSSNKSKIKQYYGAEYIITICLYLALVMFLYIYLYIDTNVKNKGLEEYIPLLILSGWVMLLRRYYDVLFQSDKRIKLLAFSRLGQPFLFLVLLSFGYYYELNLYFIFIIFLITHVVNAAFVFLNLRPSFKSLKKRTYEVWLYNKRFGVHLYIGSVLPLSLASLSGILVSYNSDDNSGVGFYALAFSLVALISIIPNTIATVLFKDFSKMKLMPVKVVVSSFILAFIALIGLVLIVKPFVYYLYGSEYETVVMLVLIMVLGLLAHGMGDLYNRFLSANGYGVMIRNGAIFTGIFLLILNVILIPEYKEYGAAISTLLAGFFYFIAMYYFYFRVVKKFKTESI